MADSATTTSVSVLFVCLGNICRSTMAEAVFRSLTSANPAISHIDSAGTSSYNTGSDPDPRTMSTLQNNGITDYSHHARRVQLSDFSKFDYVLAMDRDNLYDLQKLKQRAAEKDGDKTLGKVMLFGDFGGRKGEVVIDPYYGAKNGFNVAYEQIIRFSEGFLNEVLAE